MGSLILRRIRGMILVLLLGTTLMFFIVHLSPGDPSILLVNPTSGADIRDQLVARFGLDQPLLIQYARWMGRALLHLDFGYSFATGEPAARMVSHYLKPTLILSLFSVITSLLIGIPLGIWAGIRRNSKTDRFLSSLMLVFFAMPPIWIGSMLLYWFSIKTGWLPSSHIVSLFHERMGFAAQIGDYLRHLLLPVLSVGLPLSTYFFRFVRSEMIDVLNSDHFLAARARGIGLGKLYGVYILKNVMLPVLTILGTTLPMLLSGAVVIETIFSLPGIGRLMVFAALSRDYPVVLAAAFFAFIFVVVGNLFADIGYRITDPRIRLEKE